MLLFARADIEGPPHNAEGECVKREGIPCGVESVESEISEAWFPTIAWSGDGRFRPSLTESKTDKVFPCRISICISIVNSNKQRWIFP